jgi:acyl-CoA synthetase (AMP-forming)/AMP-acid ligase II
MVNYPGIEKADFSSVLSMSSGGAYLPSELGDKISTLMPKETVFNQGYGMSEAVCRLYPLFPSFYPNSHSIHR